jgi:hypothetical protein
MRYERTERFKADWKSLTDNERSIVLSALPRFNAAADDVADNGFDHHRWPSALRVHDIAGAPGVWSMTWHFSGPDLRATFEWTGAEDAPAIRWRRLGRHDIYRAP